MALSSGFRLGSYEIAGPLGAGGMGEVYRARDSRLGREVAIKVLPEELSRDPDALARFEREARAVAALSHPNILGIHDFDRKEGIVFAVLELLSGRTFREWMSGGPISPRKAAEAMAQVARGLAAAHQRGIVHRDIKPENLFLTSEGTAKILDFGLARVSAEHLPGPAGSAGATQPGTILGTVGYMAPEQIRSQTADARAEIFAFGAILYEAISGERAFLGASAIETLTAILNDEPAEIPESRLAGAVSLDRIARRCLEKNPDERFQCARDLGFALEAITPVSPEPQERGKDETPGGPVPAGAPALDSPARLRLRGVAAGSGRSHCRAAQMSEAHAIAALILIHGSRIEESDAEFAQALAINPSDSFSEMHRGLCRGARGRWAEALEIAEAALRRTPNNTWVHYQRAHGQIRTGDRAGASRTLELAGRQFVREVLFYPVRAIVAAMDGQAAEARRQIAFTEQNRRAFGHYHHAQYDVACALALLGDNDGAMTWLAASARNGFPCHALFERDPLLETLRGDERFEALVALRSESEGYARLWKSLRSTTANPASFHG
ncbi:MAG: serine/threonine-protein kinase [Acidobacteriota bacterium]